MYKTIDNVTIFDLEKINSYGIYLDNNLTEIMNMFRNDEVLILSKNEMAIGTTSRKNLKIDNQRIVGSIYVREKYLDLIGEFSSCQVKGRNIKKNRVLIERIECIIME